MPKCRPSPKQRAQMEGAALPRTPHVDPLPSSEFDQLLAQLAAEHRRALDLFQVENARLRELLQASVARPIASESLDQPQPTTQLGEHLPPTLDNVIFRGEDELEEVHGETRKEFLSEPSSITSSGALAYSSASESGTIPEYRINVEFLNRPVISSGQAQLKALAAKSASFHKLRKASTLHLGESMCARCDKFVVHPSSTYRLLWDLCGTMLILYDLITVPLALFDNTTSTFTDVMDVIILFFWTCDIFATFTVGYIAHGHTVMSLRRIAKRYCRSWFVPDLIIVSLDWGFSISAWRDGTDHGGAEGLGRTVRFLRSVRTIRLLRLFKLGRLMVSIQDHIGSELSNLVLEILKLMTSVLLLAHVLACLWYYVGKKTSPGWTVTNQLRPNDQWQLYTAAFEWSLAKLVLESVDVQPTDTGERIFSIGVLIFGLIVFTSVLSRLTAAMVRLQSLHGDNKRQFTLLRRYFRQRVVPRDLSNRIQKYLEYVLDEQKRLVQAASIPILQHLSQQLQDELHFTINMSSVAKHPLFFHINSVSDVIMYRLSNTCFARKVLAAKDSLLFQGERAEYMYFVVFGELCYEKINAAKKTVDVDCWICEPVLYSTWFHIGNLFATKECDMISISGSTFPEAICQNLDVWDVVSAYARRFVRRLNDLRDARMVNLSDVATLEEDAADLEKCVTSQNSTFANKRGSLVMQLFALPAVGKLNSMVKPRASSEQETQTPDPQREGRP